MAATVVDNPLSLTNESKTARKKKVKADAGVNGAVDTTSNISSEVPKDNIATTEADNIAEHPYVRELQKHVRNINKKLAALHKTDAVIAENKDLTLDELVAQRKINADQKASALKKPQLQVQLTQLEEQLEQYRKFDSDYQLKLIKQKEELTQEHLNEIARIKAELQVEAAGAGDKELHRKLLIFSQFLRAAAAKRTIEEEVDTDESRAFEGALLLVYGGDQKAVDTAVSIIEGAGDSVPSIEGVELPVTYAEIKQASVSHAPLPAEEAWADHTTEASNAGANAAHANSITAVDPTIANASLTELEQQGQTEASLNGGIAGSNDETSGNVAGERWDTAAAGISAGSDKGNLEDSYEMIPRPSEEVDVPSQQPQSTRWDEEAPAYEVVTGNKASEQWDVKAPGEQTDDNTWASSSTQIAETIASAADNKAVPAADDGFHEIASRQRGRGGGRGRGGDGEFRGRGGRRGHFRGGRGGSDGEFRGRGGFRGGRGDGEFRGGRGRGRGGPRGAGAAAAPTASS